MTARIKTGGRQKGSLDKNARQLVSAELGHSILATFEMLGGTAAMVEWAADNKTVFYTQILSRLMPAPQKDDEPGSTYNQFNIGNLSEQQVAARVAFALARGLHDDPSVTIEHAPTPAAVIAQQEDPPETLPPTYSAYKTPVEDPDRQRWASEIPLTPEQRRDAAMIRETHEMDITNYQGGAGEQGGHGSTRSPAHTADPRAAQRDRSLASRRKDLL